MKDQSGNEDFSGTRIENNTLREMRQWLSNGSKTGLLYLNFMQIQGVLSGGEHPDTLKLLITTFDIKLFFTQRTLHWFLYIAQVSPSDLR
jgi:hypothetical protein